MIREIHLLVQGRSAKAFETDGDKFVRVRFEDGSMAAEKAALCIAFHVREYSWKFSRKLLKKLNKNPNFWSNK